ncbi:MAG: molybdate ABC transporter substrate-binding protein [Kofleriaceae bacterium]|nr:molybdate ABC transporter substrate-binding protein [Kofleriaceae bacterium]
MRRTTVVFALVVSLVAVACSKKDGAKEGSGNQTSVRVAAASDLAKAFNEVGAAFAKKTGITPSFDFGSSGLFAKQIEQGAPFYLYAAANKSFVDQVVKSGKCDASTAQLYSRGRLVMWGKNGTPMKIEELADPKYKRIGIANPEHAPYGKAAVESMQKAGIYDQVKDRLVLAENVLAAATYAKEGSVDVSFFALSLAIANNTESYVQIAPDLHTPLEQTMVVCGKGAEADAARELAGFIVGDEGRAIMEKYGFSTTGVASQPK